jgi:outer membrane protein TolC
LSAVRLRTRLGSADDEVQARARLAQTLAQRLQPRHAAARAAQALAVLTGRTTPDAAWLQNPGAIPLPPAGALAPAQLPADLLRVRPDLQLAEAAVRKAAGEAGIAQADLYPHISLGMSFLYSYNITQRRRASIVNNRVPGIGPVIDFPLFDWGRRKAQAAAQREALDEALLAYRQAVLDGVAETETALSLLAEQRERADQSEAALGILTQRMAVQRGWAGAGLASEYDGLARQRAQVLAAAELADARAGHALALVALYKSLGGAPLPEEPPMRAQP